MRYNPEKLPPAEEEVRLKATNRTLVRPLAGFLSAILTHSFVSAW